MEGDIPRERRIYKQCNMGEMEDLMHFILRCPAHGVERDVLLQRTGPIHDVCDILTDSKCKAAAIFIMTCLSKLRK